MLATASATKSGVSQWDPVLYNSVQEWLLYSIVKLDGGGRMRKPKNLFTGEELVEYRNSGGRDYSNWVFPQHINHLKQNYTNCDLSNTNLANLDCRFSVFHGTDFRGADLRNADFSGSSFKGANLIGANLINANLRGVDLRGAVIDESTKRGGNITR